MVLAVDMVLTVTGHTEHVALLERAVALGTPDECQVWSLSLYVIQFSFINYIGFYLLRTKEWRGEVKRAPSAFINAKSLHELSLWRK